MNSRNKRKKKIKQHDNHIKNKEEEYQWRVPELLQPKHVCGAPEPEKYPKHQKTG